MKLICSPPSPYSAKVRMAARYLQVDAIAIPNDPSALLAANPLGKIPTLITDSGLTLYDSRTIMHYLNSLNDDRRIYPRTPEKRALVERMEALCDGICDAALLIIYENRFRPAENTYQPWIDKQWDKVMSGLNYIEENPPEFRKRLHAGHFACASMLGYLMLRFPGQWEEHRVRLTRWPSEFAEHFPDYLELKPQA